MHHALYFFAGATYPFNTKRTFRDVVAGETVVCGDVPNTDETMVAGDGDRIRRRRVDLMSSITIGQRIGLQLLSLIGIPYGPFIRFIFDSVSNLHQFPSFSFDGTIE